MKHLGILVIILLIGTSCSRKNIQMNFIKNTDREFEQILVDAKQQHKWIFVDVYATWCGPCKWMDQNTFQDEQVAEKLNKKFINYKVDGESFSGVNLALKYKVDSYPTYLFLNEKGKVLKRIEGSMNPESFIQEIATIDKLAKN